jgi:hypothetical protein
MKVHSFPSNFMSSGADKAYAVPAARGPWVRGRTDVGTAKFFYRLFRTGLRSCERGQYSGPPL